MADNGKKPPPSALQFPCDFIIKVLGRADEDFEQTVLSILKKHCPEVRTKDVSKRPSRDKNFLALTITVKAQSQKKLDAIYQELSDCPLVIMAL